MKLRCKYHEGMFANEGYCDQEAHRFSDWELRATCVHEAGHAVVNYALGLGNKLISVNASRTGEDPPMIFGGRVTTAREPAFSGLDPAVAESVSHCAGPAADWRYRKLKKIPLRMSGSRRDSSNVDKLLTRRFGDLMPSYRERVWEHTQCAVEREPIWKAIIAIAKELHLRIEQSGLPEKPQCAVVWSLPVQTAEAIMRRYSVLPSCLKPLVATIMGVTRR